MEGSTCAGDERGIGRGGGRGGKEVGAGDWQGWSDGNGDEEGTAD